MRKACSLYLTENESFQQTNTIWPKLLKHENLSYDKIEHIQPDKDVMFIKKKESIGNEMKCLSYKTN